LFELTKLISKTVPRKVGEQKFKILGNEMLINIARQYINALRNCTDINSLEKTFVHLQNEIYNLEI